MVEKKMKKIFIKLVSSSRNQPTISFLDQKVKKQSHQCSGIKYGLIGKLVSISYSC